MRNQNIKRMKTITFLKHYPLSIFTCIMICFSGSLEAQVLVSGAGTSAANGIYNQAGTFNSRDYYAKGAYYIYWNSGLTEWDINDNLGDDGTILYYTTVNSSIPPSTGWTDDFGTLPVPGVVFPVELVGFNARQLEDKISLSWKTLSELNNNYFSIERSMDADNWNSIGEVQGNGTTSELQSYTFEDERPNWGTNYYRLKQVDFGGEFAYSTVLEINFISNGISSFQVYPNPGSNAVNVKFEEERGNYVKLEVFDTSGRLQLTSPVKKGINHIDTDNLAPGIYYFHMTQKNGLKEVEKFVKK